MKINLNYSLLFLGGMVFAQSNQVGIDTAYPKALFHVDGKKDNPKVSGTMPTNTQILNDVVVTSAGNIGAGTIAPTTKLELQNGKINGAIKIVDGTQGVGKVLMSDDNGLATWQLPNSFKPVALGIYPTSVVNVYSDGSSSTFGATKYTEVYIDLTPGNWIVNLGLTVRSAEQLGDKFWLQAYLSTSKTSVQQSGFTHLGPAGSSTTYANMIYGNKNTANNPFAHDGSNFITGSSLINVTSNIRVYVLLDNSNSIPRSGQRVGNYVFPTDAWENYFHAIPVE